MTDELVISAFSDEGEHKCGSCNWAACTFYSTSATELVLDEDGRPEDGLCAQCFLEALMSDGGIVIKERKNGRAEGVVRADG